MEPETKSLLDKLERKGKHYINAQLNVSLRIYACLLNEIIGKTNKYHIGDVISGTWPIEILPTICCTSVGGSSFFWKNEKKG